MGLIGGQLVSVFKVEKVDICSTMRSVYCRYVHTFHVTIGVLGLFVPDYFFNMS